MSFLKTIFGCVADSAEDNGLPTTTVIGGDEIVDATFAQTTDGDGFREKSPKVEESASNPKGTMVTKTPAKESQIGTETVPMVEGSKGEEMKKTQEPTAEDTKAEDALVEEPTNETPLKAANKPKDVATNEHDPPNAVANLDIAKPVSKTEGTPSSKMSSAVAKAAEANMSKANDLSKAIESNPASVNVAFVVDLKDDNIDAFMIIPEGDPTCLGCKKVAQRGGNCKKCKAFYCSKECQMADWKKGGHKSACKVFAWMEGVHAREVTEAPFPVETVVDRLFKTLRIALCPYAVHKYEEIGKGFVYAQSNVMMQMHMTKKPQNRYATEFPRSVTLCYMTVAEFLDTVCKEEDSKKGGFEYMQVQPALTKEVEECDFKQETVVLFRFLCGNLVVTRAGLVPDFDACRGMGKMTYEGKDSTQINLD